MQTMLERRGQCGKCERAVHAKGLCHNHWRTARRRQLNPPRVPKGRTHLTPEGQRAAALWGKYKMTIAEYEAILASQGGVCAICRKPERRTFRGKISRLAVDHCHATGKVRGLLCFACNTHVLGQSGDDPAVLRRAADYLESFR